MIPRVFFPKKKYFSFFYYRVGVLVHLKNFTKLAISVICAQHFTKLQTSHYFILFWIILYVYLASFIKIKNIFVILFIYYVIVLLRIITYICFLFKYFYCCVYYTSGVSITDWFQFEKNITDVFIIRFKYLIWNNKNKCVFVKVYLFRIFFIVFKAISNNIAINIQFSKQTKKHQITDIYLL